MNNALFKAFSDGVFAFAIPLLILDTVPTRLPKSWTI